MLLFRKEQSDRLIVFKVDKISERNCFDAVYEKSDWHVASSEAPDFVCRRNERPVLGVEVTEFFSTESDARLEKIKGYSLDLLSGGKHRHKADIEAVKLGKLIFNSQKIDCIMRDWPSFKERVSLFTKCIGAKERKASSYLSDCPAVDLLVKDCAGILGFSDFAVFLLMLRSFLNTTQIVASPFREIFVITRHDDGRSIYFSLKLNIVVAEILALEHLIREKFLEKDQDGKKISFSLLLSCLSHSGFSSIQVRIDEQVLCLHWGPWELRYDAVGKKIQDTIYFPEVSQIGDPIRDLIAEMADKELQMAEQIVALRPTVAKCAPLFFQTRNA